MLAFALTAAIVPIAGGMQSAAQIATPKFDVVSIKPVDPGEHSMFGIRPLPGGRVTGASVTLKLLIATAYGLQDFQISGGQGWIETARYDIEARPESPVGANEWKEMLKSVLADRFHLVVHRETRELTVYALVLARNDGKLGPGMVQSKEGSCITRDPSKPVAPPEPGQQPFCGNLLGGRSQLIGTAATIDSMAVMLSRDVGRKVIDKTGLTGNFDIRLQYAPDENQFARESPPAPADSSSPSVFTALREQLGLKLEPQKAPIEILVIDRAEKPSEN